MAIRVTDVQGILRHYANMGHDVLSDPRAVHLDGKRYGMAVGHTLDIPSVFFGRKFTHDPATGVPRTHFLDTYIQQSELPIISHISTSNVAKSIADGESPVSTLRHITTSVPHIGEDNNSFFAMNSRKGTYHGVQNDKGLWVSHPGQGFDSEHDDPHKALESHISGDIQHLGKVSSDSFKRRDMEPSDMRNFNTKEAFSNISGLHRPFSNVIHVTEHDTVDGNGVRNQYTYDPDTEQLLPINK